MEKKKALELANEYPKEIICYPREAFIEQLANYLVKIFKEEKK